MRADLEPGLQMAQGGHGMAEFWATYPLIAEVWHRHSNWLIYVSVPDEAALLELDARASAADLRHVVFREPDLGNEVTAVALAPGATARRLCAQFPRALRPTPSVCSTQEVCVT